MSTDELDSKNIQNFKEGSLPTNVQENQHSVLLANGHSLEDVASSENSNNQELSSLIFIQTYDHRLVLDLTQSLKLLTYLAC